MVLIRNDEAKLRRKLRMMGGGIALVLLIGPFVSGGLGNLVASLDLKLLDAWIAIRGERPASPQVVIVGMDEKSIGKLGPFPWPREEYVPLLDKLKEGGARVIGMDVTFTPSARQSDANRSLAEAMRRAGNVVFGVEFSNLGDPSPPGTEPDEVMRGNALPAFDQTLFSLLPASELVPSEPELAAAAVALGHVNVREDSDGVIRQSPLLIKHGNPVFPGLGLQVARIYTGTPMADVEVKGGYLKVGYGRIPLTDSGQILLNWSGQSTPFQVYSFIDVVRGDVPASTFNGKAVMVAPVAKGLDRHTMPSAPQAPGVLVHATFLSNFFTVDFLRSPSWGWLIELGLIGLVLFLVLGPLPSISTARLFPLALVTVVVLLAVSLIAFQSNGVWLRVGVPCALLTLSVLPIMGFRLKHSEKATVESDTERRESQKLLGLSFQEKGMLDMALATYDRLSMTADMLPVYYALGVDYEHRGEAEKALLAYKRILTLDPAYEDTAERTATLRQHGASTRVFEQRTVAQRAPDAEEATGELVAREAAATRGLGAEPTAQLTKSPGPQRVVVAGEMRSFGRYTVLKKLGRGAMGEVFLVEDSKIGRKAALKTIRLDMEMSSEQAIQMRQRFYREAQAAGRLSHRNLVTIHDVGEDQGIAFIVMEFVEGQTLREAAKGTSLQPRQVKNILIQAALGLDYAHQNGVVHRDVKPDNIMIGNDGVVKLMDFGIARLRESEMTQAGSILGTPAYMSPEQCSGRQIDGRSDVFSLGVILYELITGVRPFQGEQPTTVMLAILQKEPTLPSVVGGAHSAWDAVIAKVLNKDPNDRYATAREFAEAMNTVKV